MRDARVIAMFVLGLLGAVALGVVEWRLHGPYGEIDAGASRSVDPVTGQTVIAFNARGHGKPDIWSFLDGDRLVRMEYDENGDGVIDRWEYFGANEALERAYELSASGERAIVAAAPARTDTGGQ